MLEQCMADVHLRPITQANLRDCLKLQINDAQATFVASPAQSLAEAYVNPNLVPLAVYDGAARGYEQAPVPVVGFTMYELEAGVGFILRLLIDRTAQHQGYGRATMVEVIRRLKLHPQVELIATSYRRDNTVAAQLYQRLGFVPWQIAYATADSPEVYVCLPA